MVNTDKGGINFYTMVCLPVREIIHSWIISSYRRTNRGKTITLPLFVFPKVFFIVTFLYFEQFITLGKRGCIKGTVPTEDVVNGD